MTSYPAAWIQDFKLRYPEAWLLQTSLDWIKGSGFLGYPMPIAQEAFAAKGIPKKENAIPLKYATECKAFIQHHVRWWGGSRRSAGAAVRWPGGEGSAEVEHIGEARLHQDPAGVVAGPARTTGLHVVTQRPLAQPWACVRQCILAMHRRNARSRWAQRARRCLCASRPGCTGNAAPSSN